MNAERWERIDKLFDAVLDLPETQREEFLATECGGDEALRDEVLALLNASSQSFLDETAIGIAARDLASDGSGSFPEPLVNRMIGPYSVSTRLGAGGMGQVYLATDSKFNRNVALKILRKEYTVNNDCLKRFELEALAISCVNHPNIVTVYDVGTFDEINYLATEYVEGKSLRAVAGELTPSEILNVGIQVCDALSAAHRSGIIHRDIKPENIMLRPDGYVKVLDFGIAKLSNVAHVHARDLAETAEGVLIGTPGYMSPEQISGERIDYRTDLWSLGVILYELLTSQNPFKKGNRQNTFHAILNLDPPPPSSRNPDVSPETDRILARSLEKNQELRFQTAADFCADLKRAKREYDSTSLPRASARIEATSSTSNRRALSYVVAGLIVASIAAIVWYFVSRPSPDNAIDWTKAKSVQLTDQSGIEYFPALAPDGKSFVYASDQAGNFDIFSKRVGGATSTNLTLSSTADDTQPAFSPNGKLIAFRSERQPSGIYVMEATGENLRRISDFGFHPSWSPDSKEIVVSYFGDDQPTVRRTGTRGIWTINVESGARREVSKLNGSFPTWSPNGKQIAFWFFPGVAGRRDVAVVPASGGNEVALTTNFGVSNWNPVWAPDGRFLYFISDDSGSVNFWRIRMNADTGEASGTPEPVVAPSTFNRHLNFSGDGNRMIYVQSNNQANIQGVEFDAIQRRTIGDPFWITSGDREVTRAVLSPNGKEFLMRQIRRTQDDLVVYQREKNVWQEVTRDAAFDRYPRWSPDGKQIAFVSDRGGTYDIWIGSPDGSNLRQVTFSGPSETGISFPIWSPDGNRLIYTVDGQAFILDLSKAWADQTPISIRKPPDGNRFNAWDWSADGKKLAVTFGGSVRGIGVYSFETNTFVRIADIAESDALAIPSWLPDSRHLVFVKNNAIVLADTETRKVTELLKPKTGEIRSPFVSNDGRLLYYSVHTSESDIWMLDHARSE